jgi:hypothetical protein
MVLIVLFLVALVAELVHGNCCQTGCYRRFRDEQCDSCQACGTHCVSLLANCGLPEAQFIFVLRERSELGLELVFSAASLIRSSSSDQNSRNGLTHLS